MAVKFNDIKRAKADAESKKEDAVFRVKATLVEYDTTGSAACASRSGYVWVQRIDQEGNLSQVFNRVAPTIPGLPVTLIRPAYSDALEVESYDNSLLQHTGVAGRTFLEQHARQHEPGGLDPMYVYLRMLTPFRTSPNNPADLSVVIAPLQYCDKTGALKTVTFPEPVDLSSYVPATGRRYVGLYYVDGAGLNVIDGDVYSTNPIRPTVDGYPTAYVLLKAGQTEIVEADIQDARLILNSVGDETYSADELTARLVAQKTMRGGGVITFAADASSLTTTAPIYWDLPNEITLSVPAQEMTLIYENSAIVANFSRAEWLITGQPVNGVVISDLAYFAYNLNDLLIATIIPAGDGVVARFANGLELLPGMSYDTATGIITAGIIHYDNATSGLTGATVQAAIDEVISGFAARVQGVVLTGLSTATNAAIAAGDSVLAAFGKLQAQTTAHNARTDNPHNVTLAQLGIPTTDPYLTGEIWLDNGKLKASSGRAGMATGLIGPPTYYD